MMRRYMNQSIAVSIERIRQYRISRNIPKSRLAKQAKVSEGILRGMDCERWNPTLDTLNKLERVIPPDFVVTEGIEHSP